jgi:integrase
MPAYNRNKDGYYKASIVTGYTQDGKQKRETIRSKNLTEFKEKLKVAQSLHEKDYDFDTKKMTVSEWADKWLETYKKPKVGEHCYETYEINLRLHINPVIGDYLLIDIKPFQLQEVLNLQKGKSKSNTEKIMFCLKQMFRTAYLNGLIVRNVSDGLTLPATTEGNRRPLTNDEREAVIKVAETHRAGLWILLMLYCGLRPEETVPLMWDDFDFTEGNETVTVQRAAGWDHGHPKIKNLKCKEHKEGEEAQRTIPLVPPLIEKLKAAKRKGLYVFTPEKSNGMLTRTNVRRLWNSFHRAVDIEMGAKVYRNKITDHAFSMDVTPYYLRHTCCSDWGYIGLDKDTVKYLMGHDDSRSTDRYTHFQKRNLDKAIGTIRKNFDMWGQKGDKNEAS